MVTYVRLSLFLLACIFALPLSAGNILPNFSFENGTGGPYSGSSNPVTSPADSWSIWTSGGLITAELLPTTLPDAGAGSRMLHIQAATAYSGAYIIIPQDTYYDAIWAYAVSGTAGIALVPSSWNGSFDGQTSALDQWQYLQGKNPVTANELVIYAVGGPADFYVDLADVDPNPIESAPEPTTGSLALLALGGGLLVASRRRTSRRVR